MIKIDPLTVIEALKKSESPFIELLSINRLKVEIYQPRLEDQQTPHTMDEFYLIFTGFGKFQMNNEISSFKAGDFLFVPAYTEHRFIEFSDDFITWVFFIE